MWLQKVLAELSLTLVISLSQCTGACWEFALESIKLPFILSGVCSPSEANYCSNPFEVFFLQFGIYNNSLFVEGCALASLLKTSMSFNTKSAKTFITFLTIMCWSSFLQLQIKMSFFCASLSTFMLRSSFILCLSHF